ncbi:MAG: DoxX family protein [Saprospiraceae bacterium]
MKTWNAFDRYQDYGVLLLRLVVGIRLIQGTIDNVLSWDRMLEFEQFLAAQGMVFPLAAAILSVYAQFICGILFIIGWQVRLAALLMIANFTVALLLVHLGDTYQNAFPALIIWSVSVFLLLNGAGKIAVDRRIK